MNEKKDNSLEKKSKSELISLIKEQHQLIQRYELMKESFKKDILAYIRVMKLLHMTHELRSELEDDEEYDMVPEKEPKDTLKSYS